MIINIGTTDQWLKLGHSFFVLLISYVTVELVLASTIQVMI